MFDAYANSAGGVDVMSGSATSPFSVTGPFPTMLNGSHNGDVTLTVTGTEGSNAPLGDQNGTVTLMTNLPGSGGYDIPVHATVIAGGIAATPDSIAFGTESVGSATSPKTTTIANCSGNDLTVTNATITGPNEHEFVLLQPNPAAGTTISNTMSQQYVIVMLPQSPGLKSAQLEVDYAGSSAMVPLTGVGSSDVNPKDRETYYACSAGGGRGTAAWPIAVACAWLARRRRRR